MIYMNNRNNLRVHFVQFRSCEQAFTDEPSSPCKESCKIPVVQLPHNNMKLYLLLDCELHIVYVITLQSPGLDATFFIYQSKKQFESATTSGGLNALSRIAFEKHLKDG